MNKKRLFVVSLVCALCALLGVFAVACNGKNTFKVTFDVQGHGTAPAQITDLESGSKIDKPQDPTADGYAFVGWYKETACTNEWVFGTDTVEADTTLYAKWDELSYTLTYDVQGHGTAPANVTSIKWNSKVTAPEAPTADGYAFEGWYKEKACANKWDFDTDTVKADVTLYANWVQVFEVTYDAQGHGTAPAKVTGLTANSKLDEPEALTATGYVFEGWYKEAACETAWDFETDVVTEDTTLYACWKQIHEIKDDLTSITVQVTDHAYINAPVNGMYYINTPSNDDEPTYLIDEIETTKSINKLVYLGAGMHTIASQGKGFEISVKLNTLDLPFTEECTYMGETYEFVVASLGIYDGEKMGTVSVYFRKIGDIMDTIQAGAVKFDGEYYTLSRLSEGNYTSEYYRIKLTTEGGKVTKVEFYTQNDEEAWVSSDILTKSVKASEVAVKLTASATATTIEETVQESFEYVYFDVTALKDQWLEFSDIADGIEFWWVDIEDGREGYVPSYNGQIFITEGESMKLPQSYYDYMVVKPAEGETTVSFKVKLGQAPAGLSAENPLTFTGATTTVANAVAGNTYYLTYTPEQAGDYVVTVSSSGSYMIYYTVNGDAYGYVSWSWVGGISNYYPYAEVTLNAGANIFAVTLGDWDNGFTITITPKSEFSFELPALVEGTYTDENGNTLTISGNADDGYTGTFSSPWDPEISGAIVVGTGANKGVYVLEYRNAEDSMLDQDYTIQVTGEGKITYYGYMYLTLGGGSVEPTGPVSGTYESNSMSADKCVLEIDFDSMKVILYTVNNVPYAENVTLTYDDEWTWYTFSYTLSEVTYNVYLEYQGYDTFSVTVTSGASAEAMYIVELSGGGSGWEEDPPELVSGTYESGRTSMTKYVIEIDADTMKVVSYTVDNETYAENVELAYDSDYGWFNFIFTHGAVNYKVTLATDLFDDTTLSVSVFEDGEYAGNFDVFVVDDAVVEE